MFRRTSLLNVFPLSPSASSFFFFFSDYGDVALVMLARPNACSFFPFVGSLPFLESVLSTIEELLGVIDVGYVAGIQDARGLWRVVLRVVLLSL